MKWMKVFSCFLLSATLCMTGASATGVYRRHQPETPVLNEQINVSPWARQEINQAVALGICPWKIEDMPSDLKEPADRLTSISYLSRLISFQENCDRSELIQVTLHCYGKKTGNGELKSVFSDIYSPNETDAMYYLGVTNGRGDGSFDPNGRLTRQEAAALLARTYQAYGGELSQSSVLSPFTDQDEVADWAKESIAALAAAGIMQGYEDGRFAPHDFYTYEQCIISLLRLYENMPVSRKHGNVKSLFSYEQYMSMMEDEAYWLRKEWQVEGPLATFVKQIDPMPNSIPTVPTYYKFVYRSGAVREIEDLGICDTGWGWLNYYIEPENPYFSEDGKTLYFTITIPSDVGDPAIVNDPFWDPFSQAHTHEAGTYQIAVDVETLTTKAVRMSEKSL